MNLAHARRVLAHLESQEAGGGIEHDLALIEAAARRLLMSGIGGEPARCAAEILTRVQIIRGCLVNAAAEALL